MIYYMMDDGWWMMIVVILYTVYIYIYIQSKLQNTILKEMGKENHRFQPNLTYPIISTFLWKNAAAYGYINSNIIHHDTILEDFESSTCGLQWTAFRYSVPCGTWWHRKMVTGGTVNWCHQGTVLTPDGCARPASRRVINTDSLNLRVTQWQQ